MSISKIQKDIKNQFISIFDGVIFVSEYGKGTKEQAFNLIKAKLLNKQIYLLLVDDFYLEEVRLFEDDYAVNEFEGKYITIDFIKREIKKSIAKQKVTDDIKNYGFGLKRFYETLQSDVQINIPSDFISDAQSPDCYNDLNNPLTEVVHELQKENKILKEKNNKNTISSNANKHLQDQLNQANAKLREYEKKPLEVTKTTTQGDNNLQKIFDKNGEHYAPDLCHAISLWLDLYGAGKKSNDSHTNLSNQWINKNTKYSEKAKSSKDRIREISTPFSDFSIHRHKESEK